MKLSICVLSLALLVVPGMAYAQACGTLSSKEVEERMNDLDQLFYDTADAETRDTLIQQLDPAAGPGVYVQEESVCRAVIQKMIAQLRQTQPQWQGTDDPEFKSEVFRYGPYYAAMMTWYVSRPVPAPDVLALPVIRGMTMIFRVSDLEFLLAIVAT